MADDGPDRLKGSSCTATIDWSARTLTFEHRGWFLSKAQKASPIVVPFDEIVGVEYDCRTTGGWFRISRRGHEPWEKSVASDLHGLNAPVDPTAFAQRVPAAAGIDESAPASGADTGSALDDQAPDAKVAEPKQEDGKVVKAVDGALDFFSKWN